VPFGAYFFD